MFLNRPNPNLFKYIYASILFFTHQQASAQEAEPQYSTIDQQQLMMEPTTQQQQQQVYNHQLYNHQQVVNPHIDNIRGAVFVCEWVQGLQLFRPCMKIKLKLP